MRPFSLSPLNDYLYRPRRRLGGPGNGIGGNLNSCYLLPYDD